MRRRAPLSGLEAWKQVVERGYEGYVAQDQASVYEGGATRRWLGVKQKGWTVAEDRLAGDVDVDAGGRAEHRETGGRASSVPHQLWWRLPGARQSLGPAGLPDEVIAWRSSRATRKLNAAGQPA